MNPQITVQRATQWSIAIDGLTSADDWGEMWFGVKRNWDFNRADSASVILVSLLDGLVAQWGNDTPDSAQAEIEVSMDGTTATITVNAPATDFMVFEDMTYELIGAEGSGIAARLAHGRFVIENMPVRAASTY